MDVYLAARFGRRMEMRAFAQQLAGASIAVTSRWIHREHGSHDDERTIAYEDLTDIHRAQVVVSFTEPVASHPGRNRGGRHVEFGIAFAKRKRLLIVGPRENVFHSLEGVEIFETAESALERLVWIAQREIP